MISEKVASDGKWTLTKTYDLFALIVLIIDYLFDCGSFLPSFYFRPSFSPF